MPLTVITIGHIFKGYPSIIEAGRTHVHMDLIVGLPHYENKKRDLDYPLMISFSLQPHALQIGFLKLLKRLWCTPHGGIPIY